MKESDRVLTVAVTRGMKKCSITSTCATMLHYLNTDSRHGFRSVESVRKSAGGNWEKVGERILISLPRTCDVLVNFCPWCGGRVRQL